MQQAPINVQELIEPAVIALGYELVGIEYVPQGAYSMLRIYIDADDGINLDDCTKVSHQVSGLLDVEDIISGQYNLEVSSPGLDRPLFTLEHFRRFVGQDAKIRLSMPLEGQRRFKGRITSVSDEAVLLNVEENEVVLPIDLIEKANLIAELDD